MNWSKRGVKGDQLSFNRRKMNENSLQRRWYHEQRGRGRVRLRTRMVFKRLPKGKKFKHGRTGKKGGEGL